MRALTTPKRHTQFMLFHLIFFFFFFCSGFWMHELYEIDSTSVFTFAVPRWSVIFYTTQILLHKHKCTVNIYFFPSISYKYLPLFDVGRGDVVRFSFFFRFSCIQRTFFYFSSFFPSRCRANCINPPKNKVWEIRMYRITFIDVFPIVIVSSFCQFWRVWHSLLQTTLFAGRRLCCSLLWQLIYELRFIYLFIIIMKYEQNKIQEKQIFRSFDSLLLMNISFLFFL